MDTANEHYKASHQWLFDRSLRPGHQTERRTRLDRRLADCASKAEKLELFVRGLRGAWGVSVSPQVAQ